MLSEFDRESVTKSVNTLVTLREKVCCDNETAIKYGRSGMLTLKRNIDNAVALILMLEREYSQCEYIRDSYMEACEEYQELMRDYAVEELSEERKAEISEIVKKWQKEDEEDG